MSYTACLSKFRQGGRRAVLLGAARDDERLGPRWIWLGRSLKANESCKDTKRLRDTTEDEGLRRERVEDYQGQHADTKHIVLRSPNDFEF